MAIEQPPSGAGAGQPPQKPRLHIDDDWKRQAQEEKERLAREIEAKAAQSARPASASGPAPMGGPALEEAAAGLGDGRELPAASFSTLVQMLATQAAIFMSGQPDPETGQSMQNLDLAKHNIDLLRVLEEKTKGNLTDEEKRLLETLLYELLMAYVSAAS
jgi:hypothetical protein